MRKAGIFIVVLALALFAFGILWPEQAEEERDYIRAAVDIKDTKDGQPPPSKEALERQTDAQVEDLYARLELKGRHFIMAGSFLFPLGAALWLIGRQLEVTRPKH
jgi:hypothetical protein